MTYRRLAWDEISVPADLPEVSEEISYQQVVMNPAATWDYFPGHYDPAYARNHGHPTIFINTMHFAGFIDRIATGWAGPYSRVVRRTMRVLGPIYAGDAMVGRPRVVAKRCDTSGATPRYLVDLQIRVFNQQDELCCPAEVSLDVSGGLR